MRTLLEDGIAKAAQGLTTLDEVVRVAAGDGKSQKDDSTKSRTHNQSTPLQEQSRQNFAEAQQTALSAKDTAGSVEKERVLVVEDSGTILKVVKYFLELEGFEVLEAQDGASGIELAKRERPNAIVTDYNMPGMDGVTMVKALRVDPLTRDIAILMLTSEDSVESETRALAGGVDDYILKPVEPRRLAARVKSLLARAKGRQSVA
jgi:PleD family two-component response regulator